MDPTRNTIITHNASPRENAMDTRLRITLITILVVLLPPLLAGCVAGPSTRSGQSYIYQIPSIRERLGFSTGESMPERELSWGDRKTHQLFEELHANHPELAEELGMLPEFTDGEINPSDVEALEDIVNLALAAANPEVEEAFELIVGSGIGNSLVRYGPRWNSQLRLLYWLAFENEFEPNDTLALAVAISNGVWEAMGDDRVDQEVRNDSNAFLRFQRTNNPHVKNYPLEGLLALAWRGNYSPTGEPYTHPLYRDHATRPVDISVYDWNTLSIETLEDMRSYAEGRGWGRSDIAKVEDFFYFGGFRANWNFVLDSPLKNNVDAVWQQYEQQNRIEGDCAIESIIVDALGKAIGVPTTVLLRQAANKNGMVNSHMYILYFDSDRNVWKPYSKQLDVDMGLAYSYIVTIFRPPLRLNRYLYHRWTSDGRIETSNMWYTVGTELTLEEVKRTFASGVPSSEMKRWLTEY